MQFWDSKCYKVHTPGYVRCTSKQWSYNKVCENTAQQLFLSVLSLLLAPPYMSDDNDYSPSRISYLGSLCRTNNRVKCWITLWELIKWSRDLQKAIINSMRICAICDCILSADQYPWISDKVLRSVHERNTQCTYLHKAIRRSDREKVIARRWVENFKIKPGLFIAKTPA